MTNTSSRRSNLKEGGLTWRKIEFVHNVPINENAWRKRTIMRILFFFQIVSHKLFFSNVFLSPLTRKRNSMPESVIRGSFLISIVLNSYYGMPRRHTHINLPAEHPIMSFERIEIKMAAVSAKRSTDGNRKWIFRMPGQWPRPNFSQPFLSGYGFRPHVSGEFAGESGTILIRSPEWIFWNPIWIRNRVDAKSGIFLIRMT